MFSSAKTELRSAEDVRLGLVLISSCTTEVARIVCCNNKSRNSVLKPVVPAPPFLNFDVEMTVPLVCTAMCA